MDDTLLHFNNKLSSCRETRETTLIESDVFHSSKNCSLSAPLCHSILWVPVVTLPISSVYLWLVPLVNRSEDATYCVTKFYIASQQFSSHTLVRVLAAPLVYDLTKVCHKLRLPPALARLTSNR